MCDLLALSDFFLVHLIRRLLVMQVLSFYLLLSLLLINVNDSKHYNYPKCCFSNTLMVSKKPQIHNISMEIIIVGYTYMCGFLLFYASLVKLR